MQAANNEAAAKLVIYKQAPKKLFPFDKRLWKQQLLGQLWQVAPIPGYHSVPPADACQVR